MTRVSTFGNYESALANLMFAQTRANEAQQRVSSQRIATDLTGFGRQSETLTALKATQSRIQGFMDAAGAAGERLSAQDLALNRVADGTGGARQAIADALAAGRLDGLMLEVEGQFQMVQGGLNAKHQGRYLFAGGNVETAPVDVMTLADLAAVPAVADVFSNDTLKQKSRIDEGTVLETGVLADEVGTDIFQIFKDIQTYHQTTPLNGTISDATRDFLTGILKRLDTGRETVTDTAARNGSMQNRVDAIIAGQTNQKAALDQVLAGKTDADMAQAITDLQLSQVAIQAAAQVVNQLRSVSLLNFLT